MVGLIRGKCLRTVPLLAVLSTALVLVTGGATARASQDALRPTDERLELLVEAALAADPVVESFEIVVTALDGSVQLNGSVDTEEERARAGAIAADVEGVVDVENEITVAEPLLPPGRTDDDVRERLHDMIADDFPDERVDVDIEDGYLTLSGAVSSAETRRRLTEIAFRAGAVLVKNELRVEREKR